MVLQPADFGLIGLTVLLVVFGMFRGFSGAFAFVSGLAVSGAGVAWLWLKSPGGITETWQRVLVAVLAFIVIFGVVRYAVKLIVGKILSQPSDSIFGVCFGIFCGVLVVYALSANPDVREKSAIAKEVYRYVGSPERN